MLGGIVTIENNSAGTITVAGGSYISIPLSILGTSVKSQCVASLGTSSDEPWQGLYGIIEVSNVGANTFLIKVKGSTDTSSMTLQFGLIQNINIMFLKEFKRIK